MKWDHYLTRVFVGVAGAQHVGADSRRSVLHFPARCQRQNRHLHLHHVRGDDPTLGGATPAHHGARFGRWITS